MTPPDAEGRRDARIADLKHRAEDILLTVDAVNFLLPPMRGRDFNVDTAALIRDLLADLEALHVEADAPLQTASQVLGWMDSVGPLTRAPGQPAEADAAPRPMSGRSCPCEFGSPCSYACSCGHPVMSGGCQRCCKYGSVEQQQAAADHLISAEAQIAALQTEREHVLSSPMAAGLMLTLKAECEAQHARAEQAEATAHGLQRVTERVSELCEEWEDIAHRRASGEHTRALMPYEVIGNCAQCLRAVLTGPRSADAEVAE